MVTAPKHKAITAHDLDVMARTIYGEARGEPILGALAVGFVILHRACIAYAGWRAHPLYGDGSIAAACQRPWQFSCWNPNDPNRAQLLAVSLDDPHFQRAFYAALAVVHGQANDRLPRATHYLNPLLVKLPDWVTGVPAKNIPPATKLGTIGGHDFYAVP